MIPHDPGMTVWQRSQPDTRLRHAAREAFILLDGMADGCFDAHPADREAARIAPLLADALKGGKA